ncbi:MAG: HU family DNA-binding protein [Desulfobacteraceae bacterium]|jgi:nucleoid DNA-binding protein
MSVNKTRLVQTIADQTGLPKRQASNAIKAIVDCMIQSLSRGDDVKIPGFGRFHLQTLKARRGRHPISGDTLQIPERRTIRFKCYKRLRETLNRPQSAAVDIDVGTDRRSESRIGDLPRGKAVVRISGIPVCRFEIKDISGNGSCILVEKNSVVLRNLRIGQEIELHVVYDGTPPKAILQRSKIAHITQPTENSTYEGHVMVGIQTIDAIPIQ